jgi:hypothetical protein
MREQIVKTWIYPSKGMIYDLDWIEIFMQLCITEMNVQPYLVNILEDSINLETISDYHLKTACFILKKQSEIAISYEPIAMFNEDLTIMLSSMFTVTGLSHNEIEQREKKSNEYITFMRRNVGGIVDNEYLLPNSVIITPDAIAHKLADLTFPTKYQIKFLTEDMHIEAQIYNGKAWAYQLIRNDKIKTSNLLLGNISKSIVSTTKLWKYDVNQVLKAFDDQLAPADDERTKNINKSYYKLLIYEMILAEFSKYLFIHKDMKMRDKIFKLIETKKITELRGILNYNQDIRTIAYQINEYKNPTQLKEIVRSTTYQFDRFNELFDMTPKDQFTAISKILDNILIISESIPNETQMFIENNYLTYMPRKITLYENIISKDALLNMIQADVNNPLKRYIFTFGLPVKMIHPSIFTSRQGEVIRYFYVT